MKKFFKIVALIVVLLLVAYGAYYFRYSKSAPVAANCVQSGAAETTITYNAQKKFDPPCVTILSGSKIIWSNQSGSPLSLGADPHPIHTGNRELTNNQFVLDIKNGGSFDVTLTKKGSFGYHNHLAPWDMGTVVVKWY